MPTAPVHNLGRIGIIRDLPPHDLPFEALSDGQNVKFIDNQIRSFQASDSVYGSTVIPPLWVLQAFSPEADELYWMYPGDTAIGVTDGATHKDISPASITLDTPDAGHWIGGTLNSVPVFTNGQAVPLSWDRDFASGNPAVALVNWPANTFARIIKPFKNFLIAADIIEGGVRNEDLVRWSTPADPGALPASWDYTDITNQSGRTQVSEFPGPIITMERLGDIMLIYKEEATVGVQFVGGQNVMRFFNVFDKTGILAPYCVTSVPPSTARHVIMTPEPDVLVHDGRTSHSILKKRWKDWLARNISEEYFHRTWLATHEQDEEVWIAIPVEDATYPNVVIIWNYTENTLGVRDIADAAFARWGIVEAGTVDESWDSDDQVWDSDFDTWDQRSASARGSGMLIANPTLSELQRAGVGTFTTSYVERLGLPIIGKDLQGAPKVNWERRKMVKEIWPRIESDGAVNIYAAAQEYRDGPVTYDGPHSFNPNIGQQKVDTCVSGRLLGFRVESTMGVNWRMDGLDLEMEVLGKY